MWLVFPMGENNLACFGFDIDIRFIVADIFGSDCNDFQIFKIRNEL